MTLYTKDHEWVRIDGETATVGISVHAQGQLGDVVFVELPEIGRALAAGESSAVVESVKAASEVYAPLAGTVAEVNAALGDNPALVNEDAEGDAWFYKLTLAGTPDTSGLMDADAYKAFAGD
jgi:glycine cleavage system H protein